MSDLKFKYGAGDLPESNAGTVYDGVTHTNLK